LITLPYSDPRHRAAAVTRRIIIAGGLLFLGSWAITAALIVSAHQRAMDQTRAEAGNLAAAFAGEVRRTLDDVSSGLERLAHRMRTTQSLDIPAWLADLPLPSAAAIQGVVIGPDGRLVSTTLNPTPGPIDLSDREHFRVHLDGNFHGIFISKPVTGRVSDQITIQVSRRVDAADGTFLGVVLFSLSPGHLTGLHKTVDLGPHGVIVLTGLDNVIRARFTRERPDGFAGVGQSIAGGPRPTEFAENASGFYLRKGVVDGVERLLSYRRVGDYPLVATVGLDLRAALASFYQFAAIVGGFTVLATLGASIFGIYLMREIRNRARDQAHLIEQGNKLAAAEELLRTSIESLGDGFALFDADDRLVLCNTQYRKIYEQSGALLAPGVRFEDLVRSGAERGGPGVAIDRIEAYIAERVARFRDGAVPFEQLRNNGRWIRHADYRTSTGGAICLRTDITELKRSEQRLSESIEALGEGFALFDAEERLVLCNSNFRKIYSMPEELVAPGITMEEIIRTNVRRNVHPAAMENADWIAERLRQFRNLEGPIEQHLGDGHWLRVTDARTPSGGIISLRADITQLKVTEAQLRQTMDNLAAAQRLAHMGSDSRDLATDYAEWSAESFRIFGVDPRDFVPTTDNVLSLVIPEDLPRLFAVREEIARGITPGPYEFRIRRPNGEIRSIHRITELVRDQSGVPIRMVGIIRDVTELRHGEQRQKELERQLLHSQKLEAVGTLAGGIAHELNNALVPIVALSAMVLQDLPATSEMRDDIETIVSASRRAQDLVKGILSFSRRPETTRTEVDLGRLVHQTLAMLRATLPATVQIDEEIAAVPTVSANADELQQVIVNLVTNAAHAIGTTIGTITIGIGRARAGEIPADNMSEEFIQMRVADTGCGMDAMTVERIFEPFYTTKAVGVGTGLGLSVVHGIIAGCGGWIEVESSEGKGTEFRVYLPVSTATEKLVEALA